MSLALEFEGPRSTLGERRLLGGQLPPLQPEVDILDGPALPRIVAEQAAHRLDDGGRQPLAADDGCEGTAFYLVSYELLVGDLGDGISAKRQADQGDTEGVEVVRRRAIPAPPRIGKPALDGLVDERLEQTRGRGTAVSEGGQTAGQVSIEDVGGADRAVS